MSKARCCMCHMTVSTSSSPSSSATGAMRQGLGMSRIVGVDWLHALFRLFLNRLDCCSHLRSQYAAAMSTTPCNETQRHSSASPVGTKCD